MAGLGSLTLGLDIGTQGAKAVVYDPKAKRVVARGAFVFFFAWKE